jgi:hypothetical protein
MGLPAPVPEAAKPQVLILDLFGGLLPASMALKSLDIPAKTFFSEVANDPLEIASATMPEATPLGDVRSLKMEDLAMMVKSCPCALVWLTGGIPCKDVSQLNASRVGASGIQSGLYTKAKEILELVKSITSNYVFTFECARMDDADRATFDEAFGVAPVEINNRGFSQMSRPRWWWIGGKPGTWPKYIET